MSAKKSKRKIDCEDQPGPKRPGSPYKQCFRAEYTKEFPLLVTSQKGLHFAFCRACRRDINIAHGGRSDCLKHVSTETHKTSEKSFKNQQSLTLLTSPSLSSSLSLESKIRTAEAKLCGLSAELNLSIASIDTLSKAMGKLFPDSAIAKGLTCGRTKATAVIKEMSAMQMGSLAQRMREKPYSIATDGSNDAVKKQFPLVVTIEGKDGLVNPELLALPSCSESATGQNIFELMDREFAAQGIPWNKCLAFGSDNANVMTGSKKGVFSFVKSKQSSVHLARCCLHLVHIAAKKGAACLLPVEDVLTDIYYYFQKSVCRQAEFKNHQALYDKEARRMLKHVPTRWLSIGRCLERLLEQWHPLHDYFRKQKENEGHHKGELSYGMKKVASIYTFLKSPTNRLFCEFLRYTIKVYDPVLLELQSERPSIHKLHKVLCDLLTALYSRFLLPHAVEGVPVQKVKVDERKLQKSDQDILIGAAARKMIAQKEKEHLRDSRITDFFSCTRQYFQEVLQYLQRSLPLDDPVLESAIVTDPFQQKTVSSQKLCYLLDRFPALLPDNCTLDEILEGFAKYQMMDVSDLLTNTDGQEKRVDEIWRDIARQDVSLAGLASTMKGILSIPHSSAACERIFSMVRKTCTDQRSCLGQDTTEALLVLKGAPGTVMDREFSSAQLNAIKSACYLSLKK